MQLDMLSLETLEFGTGQSQASTFVKLLKNKVKNIHYISFWSFIILEFCSYFAPLLSFKLIYLGIWKQLETSTGVNITYSHVFLNHYPYIWMIYVWMIHYIAK